MPVNIGPRIGIEGEAEYRKQINSIIQQAKTLASEMQAVTSAFGKNTTAQEKATATGKVLEKQIDVQRQRVQALTDMLDRAAKETGDTSNETLKWRQAVNEATAELNRMERQLDESADATDDLGDEMADAEPKVSKLGDSLRNDLAAAAKASAAAIAGAITALGAFAKVGVDYNSQMEQYTTNFTTMLGSQEEAVKKVEELKEFAASTPFSMDDLAQATQTLLAFGVESENSTDRLRQLGDIALGDQDKMQRLATAFGKVTAQGKVTGETVQQMIDAGWNPLILISEMASETMEQTQKRMSQGAISVEELEAAMEAATTGSGQFAGGMEAASQTMAGMISTLKDNAQALAGEVFQPLSDTLKEMVSLIIEEVSAISSAFKSGGMSGAMKAFGSAFSDGMQMMLSQIPAVTDAVMQLISALGKSLMDNLPSFAKTAVQIVQQLAAGFTQAFPAFKSVSGELFNNLITGLQENLPQMISGGLDALLAFSSGLRENAGQLVDSARTLIQTLWDGTITALPDLIAKVPLIVSNIAGVINDNAPKFIATAAELIGKFAVGLIENIPVIIANLLQIIAAIVDTITAFNWINFGKTIISSFAKGIENAGGNVLKGIKNTLNAGIEWLKNLPSEALKWGKDMIQGFADGIMSKAHAILDGVKSIANSIRSFLHFSRPDTGPLRNYETWMPDMMRGLAGGIRKNAWRVQGALDDATGGWSIPAPLVPAMGFAGGGAGEYGAAGSTIRVGSITQHIYGVEGQDVKELARIVMDELETKVQQIGGAWT